MNIAIGDNEFNINGRNLRNISQHRGCRKGHVGQTYRVCTDFFRWRFRVSNVIDDVERLNLFDERLRLNE